ncbi:hypothetical protein ZWY2020_048065 [Hordeum vulgare]|nr:hypothetical protein ZWY2020_048065 [Hordeum vulgare]
MATAAEAFDHAAPSRPPLPATRQEVQAAAAKAAELRALHAALRQRAAPNAGARASTSRSPATIRLPPAASPARSRTAAADEDYPVFTPTYDEEPMAMAAGLNDICHDNRSRSENWGGITLDRGGDEAAYSDYDDCINGFSSSNSDFHYAAPSSSENHLRSRGVNRIHPAFLQSAPLAGRFPASTGRTAEFKVPSSCGAFRPATIGRDHGGSEAEALRFLSSSSRVPFSSSHQPPASAHSRAKQRGSQILSWLFAKAKKKPKPETPPPSSAVIERGNMSQLLKEWGCLAGLAQEGARGGQRPPGRRAGRRRRDEVVAGRADHQDDEPGSLLLGAQEGPEASDGSQRRHRHAVPLAAVVVELCKALIQQVEEPDNGLSDKLNLLLQPHQLAIAGRHCSKAVLYHLEAIMNQTLYQDFENPSFQRNGAARHLDPGQDRRESFASFVALRNLSWSEVLRKGTRYYSEDLSRFCDQKMSCVVAALSWSWPWPEQLLQCFFVATKCVWLLHLLAFSFAPPLPILRVDDGRAFDQAYMEDILPDRRQTQDLLPLRVKIMVMPGFYVQDRVLKCKVLTTHS